MQWYFISHAIISSCSFIPKGFLWRFTTEKRVNFPARWLIKLLQHIAIVTGCYCKIQIKKVPKKGKFAITKNMLREIVALVTNHRASECWHKCYLEPSLNHPHSHLSLSFFLCVFIEHSYQRKSASLLCKYGVINFHKCDISVQAQRSSSSRKIILVTASKCWIILCHF